MGHVLTNVEGANFVILRCSRSVSVLPVVFLLAACGGLSSSKAERLIVETERFKSSPTETFLDGEQSSEQNALAAGLRDAGLVEIKREHVAMGFASHYTTVARLTSAGRIRGAEWNPRFGRAYDIPLATRRRIVNVSVANLTAATAEAKVTWVFELTDVGRQVAKHNYRWGSTTLDAEHEFTAAFKKYDDGWRFEEFKSGVL
jgi:hypothetical protein